MKKLIAIGETLIDFVPNETGCKLKEVTGFMKSPGGAPANVAACVKALGGNSQMITKLGEDAFGDFLVDTMSEVGIDISSVHRTDKANTALAFISLKQDGEREFSFYRNPSADMLLEPEDINDTWFSEGDILHFCSVDLVDVPVRKAHDRAIELAKDKGCIICFDPNIRLPLWKDHKVYAEVVRNYIQHADILKVSDEELTFITGIEDEIEALAWLLERVQVLIYTKGKDGAEVYTKSLKVVDKGYPVAAVDTTGAGDSFIGAFLYGLLSREMTRDALSEMDEETIFDILKVSQAVASIVVGRKGAISIMPSLEEAMEVIKSNK